MSKSKLFPFLALILGGLGAALRMWQRAAGYDEGGLPVSGAPAAVVLALFLAVCALGCLLAALRQPKILDDQSAAAPRGIPSAALLAVSGGLLLAGGLFSLKEVADAYLVFSQALLTPSEGGSELLFLLTHLLPLALAAASIPAAAALFYQAKRAKDGGAEAANPFAVLMPPFFCWLWLIETYRLHTSNPIVWDYVLLLFAVAALLASTYYRAGFALGAGKPRRTVFTSLLALFFAAAALPDCGSLAAGLILIAQALHALTELTALLGCLEYQPKGPAPDFPDQTTQQEEPPHEQ